MPAGLVSRMQTTHHPPTLYYQTQDHRPGGTGPAQSCSKQDLPLTMRRCLSGTSLSKLATSLDLALRAPVMVPQPLTAWVVVAAACHPMLVPRRQAGSG